jgi:hypothetical protein
VTTQTFRAWTTSTPGYYFFETQNNQNPQNGGTGILAPGVSLNGGSLPSYISSFTYLNADFNTTGLAGPAGKFNQPGEPYMDIGYRQVDVTTGDFVRDAAGMPVTVRAVNNQWDYQDLPWSNSGTSSGAGPGTNGQFDVFVAPRIVHDPSDTGNPTSTYTGWFPVPYTPGCKPGNNSCGTCNCSEPHEPYLNMIYPATANANIVVGWEQTGMETRRAKAKGITCVAASSPDDCTSNGLDVDGAMVPLDVILDGVLYNEGDYDSQGNCAYYGSLLIQGTVGGTGTPDIWFDEKLLKGTWAPPGMPRVMVFSEQTDEISQ